MTRTENNTTKNETKNGFMVYTETQLS